MTDGGLALRPILALVTSAVLTLVSCAPALREPPPLRQLAGDEALPDATELDALRLQAASLFARRDLQAAREAAGLWLRIAAADPAREPLVNASRVLAWLVNHLPDEDERQSTAGTAVHAAQWCGRVAAAEPECDYWLGAALGLQARERKTTGHAALPLIEAAFRRAAAAAPLIEDAGPDRSLAIFYVRAPGWPAGPGDADLAVEHARKAVELRPEHPANLLALGEALAEAGQKEESQEAYRRALELARQRAADGDPDGAEWASQAETALGP